MFKTLIKEINSHKITYFVLCLILFGALYVRIYRTGEVLAFYFDQGRDAMSVWNLLHNGDFFLIGPTTGIAGIFRGPFYYYLITPFYWLSKGDPVLPANFLALTSVFAIALMFYLCLKEHSKAAAIISSLLAGFSFYIMLASRWLSNPTPMLLLSILLVWAIIAIAKGKRMYWVLVSFILGLSLFHFGSSGEFFYFPAVFIILLLNRKNFPTKKIIVMCVIAFGLTILPLLLFDLRNGFLLGNNIKAFLFEKDSFQSSFEDVLKSRIDFYNGVFIGKIFPGVNRLSTYLTTALVLLFLLYLPKLLRNRLFRFLSIFLLSVTVGLLFFQGNDGNIYDYYLTGYYLIFLLMVGIFLGELWRNFVGKIVVVVFFYAFFSMNLPIIYSKINDHVDGPTTIALGNQKKAIEWIYTDASGAEFNTDVYVPPVIPHAYDYLFTWQDSTRNQWLRNDQLSLLYTLYEEDPPHPERLEAWLERQLGIGEVDYQEKFGGITVQRRHRITK